MLLFDLNGTLCHRIRGSTGKVKQIVLRPGVDRLNELRKKYHIGVYSSMIYKNIEELIDQIEIYSKCEIFDRDYVFDRDYTVPFTHEECKKYNISKFKTKKCLSYLFKNTQGVKIVDNDEYKIVDKREAIIVPTFTGEEDDRALHDLVDWLLRIR